MKQQKISKKEAEQRAIKEKYERQMLDEETEKRDKVLEDLRNTFESQ